MTFVVKKEPEPVPVPGQRRYQGGRGGQPQGKRGLSRQQTMMEIPEEPMNPLAIMFGFGG